MVEGLVLRSASKCAQSNCAHTATATATATATVTAPATANSQDDKGCKKRRIAGRTRGKRLLVLMNPLNAPGVVETQCSRPSINGQTGEPWWATCQASSSSANLSQCRYIDAGLQVAFPVTTPAKALPAVPQPTSVLLSSCATSTHLQGCAAAASQTNHHAPVAVVMPAWPPLPRRPFWGYSTHALDDTQPQATLAALLRIVTDCFPWVLCNPTVETSCMHADDAHAEKPPCPWRPFLLDRQVDPRQSARPPAGHAESYSVTYKAKMPMEPRLSLLPTLPTTTPPALFPTPGSYPQPRGYCRLVICAPNQDWHRLLVLLPSDSTRIGGETMP
ncbi:hypothetical protein COCMIDRAFT_27113 [Bipolaris oryzae ATCC 44560]|uniref:Uncharacterized protein n=1 Tax=Bipolaris oryzae ATCC 44560 TaxID=930090 RepID=W6YYZ7_COCMI|nr:uncharacterized protein COCMIDRAFT_27113 [Bipolaris oryzae ATCC 44560]EUC44597.1 hypothetical protein COCMIDRAFT_27113 [Bipolaris oryzae ATCC 44560]